MKKLIKNMPLLAFVLAAASALAFNMPQANEPTKVFTWNDQTMEYDEITHLEIGEDYVCNPSSEECRVEFSNDNPDTGVKNVLTNGEFTEL
ncbi:hypothetical protein KZP23_21645 [Echinicola marina]|uniref:DUF6520 family protein n=1 Tax=Echinicola marina TaxID=2859768 RepID=UPI001CF6AB2A|nr:DUF6520 family protein [Echinicola marina]UCS93221.1 hypothetical protein KZP23_21645 [Echinicola marina]